MPSNSQSVDRLFFYLKIISFFSKVSYQVIDNLLEKLSFIKFKGFFVDTSHIQASAQAMAQLLQMAVSQSVKLSEQQLAAQADLQKVQASQQLAAQVQSSVGGIDLIV